ncbi:hypothetical protein ACI79J_09920 [Geodermatophilus sp. SYSU D01062]
MTDSGVDEGAVDACVVDPRRPEQARAWVRAAAAARGWPPDVVEEVLLLLSEVLVADAAAPGPRPVRLLDGGPGLEVRVAGRLPGPGDGGRLALAASAATAVRIEAGDGGWVRLTAGPGGPAPA